MSGTDIVRFPMSLPFRVTLPGWRRPASSRAPSTPAPANGSAPGPSRRSGTGQIRRTVRSRFPRLLRGFRVPWWMWLVRAVLAVVVAIVITAMVTVGEVWWVGRQDHRPAADAVIVLGASQYNGRPSAVFAARLDHAAELYRSGVAPKVITVGGRLPGDQYTEAQAGANYLARQGVPRSALLAVPEGSDTLLSLSAAAGEMNVRSLHSAVLVTDRWHSLRSVAIARDLGLAAATSPATTGPANRGVSTQVRYIVREAVGYRFYQLFHRPSPTGVSRPAV
jgi:vancomycin permeability regulator SanA